MRLWAVVTFAVAASLASTGDAVDLNFEYFLHDNLTEYLQAVAEEYPLITRLHSIGKSVEGTHFK